MPPRVEAGRRMALLGSACDAATLRDAVSFATRAVEDGRFHSVLFANAGKVVAAARDRSLAEALDSADLVGADGQSLVWASRVLGQPLPERVAGIDYMLELLRAGSERRWRAFLLGATDDVLERVERTLCERYPGLVIAGRRNGYFGPERDAEVAAAVAESRADVLFVGMPSPRKELWIVRNGPACGVPLAVGAGGSFDVIAGTVRRAPRLWQRLGMEWLWRVLQEPRRLWRRYLTTNTRFLAMVARERLRRGRR